VGGFDFPFSLPRELVVHLGWPLEWAALVRYCAATPRATLREVFKAYCDARPTGSKFAHRVTDIPAGSSPSMKWVNPPVAWMYQAGAHRLLDSGVRIPGIHDGDADRIALEAYPGMLARSITRASYKSDSASGQTPPRAQARRRILQALVRGSHPLGIRLSAPPALREDLLEDGQGDTLDAALCTILAAWAWQRREANFGLPQKFDPLEGWIVAAEVFARTRT
jgi:hypothetical protein